MRSFAAVLVLTGLAFALIGCESETATTPSTGAATTDAASKDADGKPGTKSGKTKAPPKLRRDL